MLSIPTPTNDAPPTREQIEQYQQSRIRRDLFNRTLKRILNVLKHNYLPEFNRNQILDLNKQHTKLRPALGFNTLAGSKQAALAFAGNDKEQSRQTNIFGCLAKSFSKSKPASQASKDPPLHKSTTNVTDRQVSHASQMIDTSSANLVSQTPKIAKIRSERVQGRTFVSNVQTKQDDG